MESKKAYLTGFDGKNLFLHKNCGKMVIAKNWPKKFYIKEIW